jgi:flagellar biosynthesis/type III secretory pathway chaperone
VSQDGSPEDSIGLDEVLENGIEWMQSLKAALMDEREALEHRNSERLAAAARTKDALTTKLLIVDRHRTEIGLLAEQVARGDNRKMQQRLITFRRIASDCERLNRTNGIIIRARHRQIMDGLSVLRGRDHDEDTYTLRGKAEATGSRRTLTEA